MRRATNRINQRGNATVEFAFLLPLLLAVIMIMVNLGFLLDHQLKIIHLGREAASVLSRGSSFNEAFTAVQNADGSWGAVGTRPEQRLYLTGSLAGLLARTRVARPSTLAPAVDFLASLWSPERVEGGRWSAILAIASNWTGGPRSW